MKRFLITAILLLTACSTARADFDITALPDHTAPAAATDGLVVYKYSAAEGSRVQEVKASADAGQCLSGTWTWVDFQPLDTSLTQISGLTLSQGDILYYDGSAITNLGPGDAGKLLQTNGVGANPTWTSAIALDVFGLPNGVAPTVDETGETAIDTTSDQLLYYGGAKRVLTYKEPLCITVENLAAADDDYAYFSWPYAVTITGLWCHYRGTGSTPATITLEDGAGNAMTITDTAATCAASTTTATPKTVTAANGLTAYEMLAFNVTNAVSPETDEYTICVSYTVDAD